MQNEKRRQPRFSAIGRVEADDICVFPGTLVNISSTGCRIRFPIQVTIDKEKEYELKVKFSQNSVTKEMLLIGQPVYAKNEIASEIGFKLLRSPGSRILESYIESFMMEIAMEQDDCFVENTSYAELNASCQYQ